MIEVQLKQCWRNVKPVNAGTGNCQYHEYCITDTKQIMAKLDNTKWAVLTFTWILNPKYKVSAEILKTTTVLCQHLYPQVSQGFLRSYNQAITCTAMRSWTTGHCLYSTAGQPYDATWLPGNMHTGHDVHYIILYFGLFTFIGTSVFSLCNVISYYLYTTAVPAWHHEKAMMWFNKHKPYNITQKIFMNYILN